MRRVVITGLGIVSGIGNSVPEVLESLRIARIGIRYEPVYAEKKFRSHLVACPTLDPSTRLDRRYYRFMGTGAAWNAVAMSEAIEDAGLEPDEVSNDRTGIIMGSGGPSTAMVVAAADTVRASSPRRIGPYGVTKAMSSTHSATLAVAYSIRGVNYTISSACSTSTHCIGNAAELIQTDKQDIVFAGGGEELDWTLSALFDAMGTLSSRFNDQPLKAGRAFDLDRDGFVIAGGAGVVVVEELEHALARGADIYAELVGYGATSDGADMVQPSGEGAARCMQMALKQARRKVDYINAHATSTVVGDPKEVEAIKSVFGSDIPPVSSTKSMTGHSLGAAGVQEAIYSLLMLKHGFICPSINVDNLDPACSGIPIVLEHQTDVPLATVLSNSFGFGGTNGTLIFSHPDAS